MQLRDKVALITGGGRGIGQGIVTRFLEEGAYVSIVQRGPLPTQLHEDRNVIHITADLSDLDALRSAVDQTVEHFGRLDVLANNAGVMFEKDISQITPEDWDLMVAINLRAPIFLIQAAVEYMRAQGNGNIITVGSLEGSSANPLHALYSTTKSGVDGLTRALAVDLGADGIRCNSIAPGWITSELSEKYLASLSSDDSAREALLSLHPLRRLGTPEDIGDAAVHLASDRSSFVTGQVHVVDGGRSIQVPMPTNTGQ